MPYIGAYNASKFALDGFTHTLRQELRNTPIHISIIAPGPVTSKLRENAKSYFTTEINNPSSAHKHAYKRIEQRYSDQPSEEESRIAVAPDILVKDLVHALESKHPRTHYYIGNPAKTLAFMQRLLPERMLDWMISKF